METFDIQQKSWWNYLTENQQDLLLQSIQLLNREEKQTSQLFHDYSFLVFPAAKAYEGFLKKLFLDLGVIVLDQYEGSHFRIGKALNPSLEQHLKNNDWIYENLKNECNEELPQDLWDTWKKSRNLIFHWFPGHKNMISLSEAKERIKMIVDTIDKAFKECRVKSQGNLIN